MSKKLVEEKENKFAKSYRLAARHHQLIEKVQNAGEDVTAQQKINQRELENLTHGLNKPDEAEFARIYFEELRKLAEGEMHKAAKVTDKSHKSSFALIAILILVGIVILVIMEFFPNIMGDDGEGGVAGGGNFVENLQNYYGQKELPSDWEIASVTGSGNSFFVEVTMPDTDVASLAAHDVATQMQIVASICPKERENIWQQIDDGEVVIGISASNYDIPTAACKDFFAGGISYPAVEVDEVANLLSLSGPQNLRGGQGKVTIR